MMVHSYYEPIHHEHLTSRVRPHALLCYFQLMSLLIPAIKKIKLTMVACTLINYLIIMSFTTLPKYVLQKHESVPF